MAKLYPKVLIVEGDEDKRVIPELMESNGVVWIENNRPIVHIRPYDGYENITADVIATELKASGLTVLGIVIDADENPLRRWESIRNAALPSMPGLPAELPDTGLVHTTANGIRFGIWLMPDNINARGMLETFLAYLIPSGGNAIWALAKQAVQEAKGNGATFTAVHADKANIYTWLAWQKPPGRQLHQAITQRILDPAHPEAQKFMSWFKTLYEL